MFWQTTRFRIDLTRPKVMGIVNLTPDSFSDGGQHASVRSALQHCEQLVRDGADILDLGAESTRPGAQPVPVADELQRLLPVLQEALKLGVPISVDTYKPDVMGAALDLGADIINDVWALRQPGAVERVAAFPGSGLCLMHMHGEPETMQSRPMEGDVIPQLLQFWEHITQYLQGQSIDLERIVADPGVGFGKTPEQNFSLLSRQRELLVCGFPLLAGWSRKSSLAVAAGLPSVAALPVNGVPHERMVPSVVAAVLAVERGASIVRVHDVMESVKALRVLAAVNPPN